MNRTLKPELLDSLPPDDPAARHSRRDLRVVNRIIGNERWFLQVLRSKLKVGERVLELGAGTGEIGMALSAAGFAIDGLDICPRPNRWPYQAEWYRADIRSFPRYTEYSAVMANLTLHHFNSDELAALGTKLAGVRLIVASEPVRRRRSQAMFAAFGPLLGANHITLHDARISIVAGFLGDELPQALGLTAGRWKWKCEISLFGAYRMIAHRR
jgi:SAM-dependent methyltransferase